MASVAIKKLKFFQASECFEGSNKSSTKCLDKIVHCEPGKKIKNVCILYKRRIITFFESQHTFPVVLKSV